jgi:hypothetical protein
MGDLAGVVEASTALELSECTFPVFGRPLLLIGRSEGVVVLALLG